MSEFNVKFGTTNTNRVVQRDSGTNVTLKTFQPGSNVKDLADVDMNSLPDGAVLVYEASSKTFQLRNLLVVDGDVVSLDGGNDF
jgi:hypothetical protein